MKPKITKYITIILGLLLLAIGLFLIKTSADTQGVMSVLPLSLIHIYSKVLFEKAFACKADVDLIKSIKMGDEICLMKITLQNPVWSQGN